MQRSEFGSCRTASTHAAVGRIQADVLGCTGDVRRQELALDIEQRKVELRQQQDVPVLEGPDRGVLLIRRTGLVPARDGQTDDVGHGVGAGWRPVL